MRIKTAQSAASRHVQAKLSATARRRGNDDPAVQELRRDLRAEQLAEHIRLVVEAAPSLKPDQVDRLTALLRGGASR